MPLPPAHFLLGAAAAELARIPTSLPLWKVLAVGAFFGLLPDLPTGILFLMGADAPHHGLYTHNLVALVGVGLIVGAAASPSWGLVAAAAYASHLLADLLREGTTTSVYLGWPLSNEAWAPLAPVFSRIPFDRQGGTFALYSPDPMRDVAEQTLMAAGVLVAALLVAAAARRVRGRRAPSPRHPRLPRRRQGPGPARGREGGPGARGRDSGPGAHRRRRRRD
jgi:hypothetical protein